MSIVSLCAAVPLPSKKNRGGNVCVMAMLPTLANHVNFSNFLLFPFLDIFFIFKACSMFLIKSLSPLKSWLSGVTFFVVGFHCPQLLKANSRP